MGILCASEIIWDLKNLQLLEMKAAGTKAMNHTLDNAAAVDAGSGLVTIPLTAHGYKAESHISIRGSTNYDGTYEIQSVATNTFNILATYVAETFINTETVRPELDPEIFFRILEVRLHLSAVGGASENFTIDLDSGQPAGALHDVNLETEDMAAKDSHIKYWGDELRFFNNNDKIIFQYANTNNKSWGLEVKYLRALNVYGL